MYPSNQNLLTVTFSPSWSVSYFLLLHSSLLLTDNWTDIKDSHLCCQNLFFFFLQVIVSTIIIIIIIIIIKILIIIIIVIFFFFSSFVFLWVVFVILESFKQSFFFQMLQVARYETPLVMTFCVCYAKQSIQAVWWSYFCITRYLHYGRKHKIIIIAYFFLYRTYRGI